MNIDDAALALPGLEAARREARKAKLPAEKKPVPPAPENPVAQVLVDLPLAHLDRPFDYRVTAAQHQAAVPGARVKVRFAGQQVDGFVLARMATSDHDRLQPLLRVVSAEPVLTAEVAELAGEIAARWAGTRADVLRLAVPPRHATTEKMAPVAAVPPALPPVAELRGWTDHPGGPQLIQRLAQGAAPRVVWNCLPGQDWTVLLAEAAAATLASGRGALLIVPDRRDADRLDAALTALLGAARHVLLTADAGPAERYRAFLAVVRGQVRCVVGTRAAAFAPVHDLGLVAIWDDGDDLYAEPRAPYCHTREVLLLRARQTGCAALVGGYARSAEAQYLVRTGWAEEVAPARDRIRDAVTVAVTGASDRELAQDPFARTARVPRSAHQVIAEGIATGPVLVQTPRGGYAMALACEHCRTPASCGHCHGPLRIPGAGRLPQCGWCAREALDWACAECGGRGLRAPVLGDQRTAEELGRAHPGVPVRTSSGEKVLTSVSARPGIVVATTGAEPAAEGGYAAVVLLDTWLLLGRDDLRAEEEALRRWANAAALVCPGGAVVAVGEPSAPALQALVRWDPAGFAERVIAERLAAHLPPASRLATVTGPAAELEDLELGLPEGGELLGPVPVDADTARLVVRVPRAAGPVLSTTLAELQRHRSARKQTHLRVQIDPREIT